MTIFLLLLIISASAYIVLTDYKRRSRLTPEERAREDAETLYDMSIW